MEVLVGCGKEIGDLQFWYRNMGRRDNAKCENEVSWGMGTLG
jgi:hypothetical protein